MSLTIDAAIMIDRLIIKNYAIIDNLQINFSKGLTIITGETGAGKSILLGAMELIMGKRADTKVLFNQEVKCVIEGSFNVKKYNIKPFFDENDIDFEEETIIRREITPAGKTRAFINDTPVNLKTLTKLSSSLIDLHQQFDTLDIHQVGFQLRMVDALAQHGQILHSYDELFIAYSKAQKEYKQLKEVIEKATKNLEFNQYQYNELSQANLSLKEEDSLEQEHKKLTHAQDIKKVLTDSYHAISESDQAVYNQLQEIVIQLNNISRFDDESSSFYSKLSSLILELDDLANDMQNHIDSIEINPQRAFEIQQRLDLLFRLQKKHNVISTKQLIEIQNQLHHEINNLEDQSSNLNNIQNKIHEFYEKLITLAEKINQNRRSVIPKFQDKIHDGLKQLGMNHARININIQDTTELLPTGKNTINYEFAANKGSRLQDIKDVASGGELSRLTLITKSLVASAIPLPTLIFDEIDSGVSGHIAQKMGFILRRLSNKHQVVVITHSPQVASQADTHYFVYKSEDNNRTSTHIKALEIEDRINIIATMLSQNPPSKAAIQNAKDLLKKVPSSGA